MNDFEKLLVGDTEFSQQRRHLEERTEKSVALHAELQVGAIGGLAGDLESRQGEDADLLRDDLLARPQRQLLPRHLAFLVRLPHQASALGESVERIGVRERLRIATQHHGHVAQVAIDANALRRSHHEVGGGGSLLLGTVLGIGADVNDFLGIAQLVDDLVALVEQVIEVADDRAEVLAGGDGAPSADGMKAHRDRTFG